MEEHKKHNKKKTGGKANAKKKKNDDPGQHRNPKAFAIQSVVKAQKKFHRSQDVKQKKMRIPLPIREVAEPPPVVVAIVGPPKVGKTTLLKAIIKNFTGQRITDIKGPLTVVSGKHRRLTLLECSNDLNHMIDVAKVADLVLLLVDANFGFEMEIFEFLNICQVHGFPKVMGILNHLDTFRDSKKMRKAKKLLKDRFWTEIYQGAKLFYLSGMVGDEYQRTEVHNLCRFISVMKFPPLSWRCSHPYILVDRMEDITPPEKIEQDSKCNRRITLYGYNRGMALKNQQAIHIPGMGDFHVADVENLPDPCPTPNMEKRRTLNQKERMVYAPMSGVGGILYDKDAVYIDVGGSHYFHKEEPKELPPVIKELLKSLKGPEEQADADSEAERSDDDVNKMPTEQLFSCDGRIRRKAIFENDDAEGDMEVENTDDELSDQEVDDDKAADEEEVSDSEGDDSEEEDESDEDGDDENEENGEDMEESDEDDSGDEDEIERKTLSHAEAEREMKKRKARRKNWQALVYGDDEEEEEERDAEVDEDDQEIGGLFRVIKKQLQTEREQKYDANLIDCSKCHVEEPHDWELEEVRALISDCFVTGRWSKTEDMSARLQEDDELYGDFEDLETGETYKAETEEKEDGSDGSDQEDEDIPERKKTKAEMTAKERLEQKRLKKKQEFDARYDNRIQDDDQFYKAWKGEMEEQAKLNRAEFEGLSPEIRQTVEGFRPGLYLRVEVADVPCEFIKYFKPTNPLIIGGLSSIEQNIGYVQVRFKKHRWYNKILKTKNPLILSVGWRRFQSIPLYSKVEDNMRYRMLKYTPPHMYCMASFWGPMTPQGSGVLAVENVSNIVQGFRIAGTGSVTELDKSLNIVKKLKLIGTPFKIMQKTAFIQGMFNSHLEVAKFEGAEIKTVSNVRGIVKKGLQRLAKTGETLPAGTFRATFEDRILMSDIVFLTTWYKVEVPQFYNPVTSLLGSWQAMKTVGQLRHERGISVQQNEDSLYKPVERKVRRSTPLVIPRALQRELPFKVTPKNLGPASPAAKRVPVVSEPSETKRARFLHKLRVVHEHNMRTKHAIMRQRAHKHQQQLEKRSAEKEQKMKDTKKDIYRLLGKMQKAKAARDMSRIKSSSS